MKNLKRFFLFLLVFNILFGSTFYIRVPLQAAETSSKFTANFDYTKHNSGAVKIMKWLIKNGHKRYEPEFKGTFYMKQYFYKDGSILQISCDDIDNKVDFSFITDDSRENIMNFSLTGDDRTSYYYVFYYNINKSGGLVSSGLNSKDRFKTDFSNSSYIYFYNMDDSKRVDVQKETTANNLLHETLKRAQTCITRYMNTSLQELGFTNYKTYTQSKNTTKQNSKKLSDLDNKMKKSAVLFTKKFAENATNAQGTTAPNAVEQLKSLKNELYITKYSKDDLPDEVLEAFATAVLDTVGEANIDKYETNPNKLTEQIYKQIKAGINSAQKKITLKKGSKKVVYTVDFTIMASSFMGNAAQVSYAEVSWKDTTNNQHTAYITATSSEESMKKALASYCATLAQLNKGLWKDFLVKYFTDGWKLAGLNSIKEIDDKTVSKYFDNSEKMILALSGNQKAKKDLLSDADGDLKQKILEMTKKQFQEFIKENVPNGNKIIVTAEKYKKCYQKYNDCKKKYEKWKKTQKNEDLTQYEKAYNACNTLLNELNNML